MGKFIITAHSGFHMQFANGWTVSVQFGRKNYCDKRDTMKSSREADEEVKAAEYWESKTAEIAAWDKNGKHWSFGVDRVKGWVTPDEVSTFMAQIADLPEDYIEKKH